MLLQGKRVIVTGAFGGIGEATVTALLEHGAVVALTDMFADDHSRVVDYLADARGKRQGSALYRQVDVTSRESVDAGFISAAEEMGGLDAMINMAGVEQPSLSAEMISEEELRRQLDVHMGGTFHTNQCAFHLLKESGGSIVNYSSIVGIDGFKNNAAYGAAKGAVSAWTRNVALDWGKYNIRVNTVVPGAMTPMLRAFGDSLPKQEQEAFYAERDAAATLGGKLHGPDRVAGTNVFLVSDLSNWIHGQILAADGGMVMVR